MSRRVRSEISEVANKHLLEAFDELSANGENLKMSELVPLMLRLSKHEAMYSESYKLVLSASVTEACSM